MPNGKTAPTDSQTLSSLSRREGSSKEKDMQIARKRNLWWRIESTKATLLPQDKRSKASIPFPSYTQRSYSRKWQKRLTFRVNY